MPINLKGRSILTLDALSSGEIRFLLRLAADLKAAKSAGIEVQRLKGKYIALIFEKDSTRTRTGFEVAAYDQGAHVTYLGPTGSQIGHKESMKDTARVLGRIYDAIEFRGFSQQSALELAQFSGVPVYNGLTDEAHPTQALGEAEQLAEARGWTMAEDGKGWRRVVASPRPLQVLEARVIELLVSQGVTVICAGGGGIPVLERSDGCLVGVEAVIDKDLASALLARQLGADHLMLLTDVEGVYLNWGTDSAQTIKLAGVGALHPGDFASGSMGPKIEAAAGFVAETGRPASIGRLEDAALILTGVAGTRIDTSTTGIVLQR